MLGKEIKDSRVVPLYEVKELIAERAEAGELNYEQNAVSDYAKKFAKLPKTKGAKLFAELSEVEGVDAELAVKITDLMPRDIERLRLLIPKNAKIDEAKQKEILGIVEKYSKD
jgi:DNA-directed RNA polymerase subunit F